MRRSARHRLRDNIRRLLDEKEVTYTALVESGAVTNGALGRIISDEGQSVNLRQLDMLAEALDVEPWQLLHPDFEVSRLSHFGVLAGQKLDELPEELRPPAYALFVQQVNFGNTGAAPAAPASAPGTRKPKRLRPVHR